tara:strand:- start:592 stop:765 length:174 start_codon:yes stop_codon:yes gene_type:complete
MEKKYTFAVCCFILGYILNWGIGWGFNDIGYKETETILIAVGAGFVGYMIGSAVDKK